MRFYTVVVVLCLFVFVLFGSLLIYTESRPTIINKTITEFNIHTPSSKIFVDSQGKFFLDSGVSVFEIGKGNK